MTIAIDVQQVSKVYRRGVQSQISIRHEAGRLIRQALSWGQSTPQADFYALKDVSFQIRQGESVALIGNNGAGKSTMLRLLAKITRQSAGDIVINGAYTALIELGTGFHPDLTGRQNIFLNGAIHGMSPKIVADIANDVIDFAELGNFIDSPVRSYSSGMLARLGFSMAVNIRPDIILVDEILAVGDAQFRAKCEQRMYAMLAEGKTLVLVSHILSQIEDLCQRVIWLEQGQVKMDGDAKTVIAAYQATVS